LPVEANPAPGRELEVDPDPELDPDPAPSCTTRVRRSVKMSLLRSGLVSLRKGFDTTGMDRVDTGIDLCDEINWAISLVGDAGGDTKCVGGDFDVVIGESMMGEDGSDMGVGLVVMARLPIRVAPGVNPSLF
jgi:hypothetical protein